MADGDIDMLGIETYFCDDNTSVRANSGGYSEILVDLNSDVKEGDTIAVQMDAFGDDRETYLAPVSGKVLSVATDPFKHDLRACNMVLLVSSQERFASQSPCNDFFSSKGTPNYWRISPLLACR
jgi:Na+-translocating ferredoxin:NAD+ oxidoreductase RnfC subunit